MMVHVDPADQGQAVARALEVGVNCFDTAVDFGDASEKKSRSSAHVRSA
jgi:aryl-alcohol dehydrogenase-like predicted oxidoreductase